MILLEVTLKTHCFSDSEYAAVTILALCCSRWQRVCVLGFPPRLSPEKDFQALLDQEYHWVSASWGLRYFSAAEKFPMKDLKLWSKKDGVHLSDCYGMVKLAKLIWETCYTFLETSPPPSVAPSPLPVSDAPSRESTGRDEPREEVTTPVPVSPPPPPQWMKAGPGRKLIPLEEEPEDSQPAPEKSRRRLVQPEVETVFSILL